MEAMILAAGEGRRLRPLTDSKPKALVEVGGAPLIEWVARDLIAAGAHRLIVNAHHLADEIEAWAEDQRLGVPVLVSREDGVSPVPLETGGGLRHARPLFEAEAPFLLHNSDVLTEIDLRAVFRAHVDGEARDGRLATLVVSRRATSRPLLIDAGGVYGRANRSEGWEVVARVPTPDHETGEVGFAGIHVISERLFDRLEETGAFSVIDAYMRLIGAGETIAVFDATGMAWHDVGTPERLEAAGIALSARSVSR